MRVLFLTDSLSDLDGVGRYAVRLISALERESPGLEIEVLLGRKHKANSPVVQPHWNVSIGLPPDYYFYMSPARFWASTALCLGPVWRAARRADLVHAIKDYPHSLLGLLGAKLAGKPCVATAHGTYSVQPLLDARHRGKARWAYKRFARMISVSRYTQGRMLELLAGAPPGPDRMAVIPNAVDADHYVARREVGEQPWHGRRYTLSIGEVKERKGHHLSVAAWCRLAKRHPDLHHFVVGRGTGDAYQLGLIELSREARVGDRLHFLGNVSEDEKIDLLQSCELFVHTPVTAADGGFEGFGLVYLEASACGKPVIGTLGCGAEDAILDGETGLLVPQRVDAVEDALEQLLGDAELRARMGARGREHAAANTWEQNARQVLALYDQVLGRGGGA
jgi:phosphatidylinositol alpha-1,6-mannosyltransferase